MIFTITGYLGSGKSTICEILNREYNFKTISAGSIFRKYGLENNSSVLELTRKLKDGNDSSLDNYIDNKIKEEFDKVKEDENVIFDSRLAWHFLNANFNIFIVVSPYQAALRTYHTRNNKDETYASLKEAIDSLVERRVLENRRYKSIYGVNCEDLTNYDLVIDTSYISALEACDIIMDCYNKKMLNMPYEKLWISPEFVFPSTSIDNIDKEKVKIYLDKIYKNEKLDKVELIRIHDALFIKDGHNRIVAYNVAKIRMINPCIVLSEEDVNSDGKLVKKDLFITLEDLKKWEELNGFTYNYVPNIVRKRNEDASS